MTGPEPPFWLSRWKYTLTPSMVAAFAFLKETTMPSSSSTCTLPAESWRWNTARGSSWKSVGSVTFTLSGLEEPSGSRPGAPSGSGHSETLTVK